MANDSLPTHLWAGAFIRRCSSQGIPVILVNQGEKMGGTVLFKIYQPPDKCRLLSQIRNFDGQIQWLQAHKEEFIDEVEASIRIRKAIDRDPDVWVIEVETKDCNLPFDPV